MGVEAASLEDKGDVGDAGFVFIADLFAAVKDGRRRLAPLGFSNWQHRNIKERRRETRRPETWINLRKGLNRKEEPKIPNGRTDRPA